METTKAWKARAAGYETGSTDGQARGAVVVEGQADLDAIIRRHQAQIAESREQIEKSDEIISLSLRRLALYEGSVEQIARCHKQIEKSRDIISLSRLWLGYLPRLS
jgi:hypothetical protein